MNRAFLETYGYLGEEVLGRPAALLDSPRNDPWIREDLPSQTPRGGWSGVVYNTRRNGTEIPVSVTTSPVTDASGRVLALVRIARDVTRALEAEEALRRSEEQFRSIVESALDAVVTIGPQGLVESYNPAAERLFGWSADEVIGRPVEQLLPNLLEELGVLPRTLEMETLRKDATRVPIEVALSLVRGSASHCIAAFVRDLSERLEIARLKDELVAMVSHELRTPLTSVGLSLRILQEETVGPLPPAAHDVLAVAERNVGRMIRLANDVLDLKRLEAGRMEMRREPVPLQAVVERCLETLQPVARAQGVVLDAAPTEALALGDDERIAQVLTNLLANAIRFSPAGGRVLVEARADGAWAEVRVSDEGPGIPARYRESIFERYRQVPRGDGAARKGSGLGLAICKAIVAQSGGSMRVESEEGRGSCFSFRLPRAPEGYSALSEPGS